MKTYRDIAGDGGSNIVDQVAAQARRIEARLSSVKHSLAVMSGKGGVGKSSVTVNIAATLALSGHAVGILDADINGPSISKMAGVRRQQLQIGAHGVTPATDALGVKIMSMDLFLPDDRTPVLWEAPTQKDAHTWRGMMESAALREFIADTEWGVLDFLLIDLPPGTDKLPNLIDRLPGLSGCLIVTLPSGVSQFVVGKSIHMAKEILHTPVIGLIENMSAYRCPHCGKTDSLFPPEAKVGGKALARRHHIPYLGEIPFDPRISLAADAGEPYVSRFRHLPAASAFSSICDKICSFLESSNGESK